MNDVPAVRGNKNWLLIKFRQWHSWGGLFLSLFIMIVAVTGILLNHKEAFLHGNAAARVGGKKASGLLTSTTDFNSLPVTFAAALDLAHHHFGAGPLEKIELKDERGQLIYKVVRGEGEELIIDARTGEMKSKYGIRIAGGQTMAGEVPEKSTRSRTDRAEMGWAGLNWAKIVDDLHTGKIFGTPGKLLVDLTSGVIIALTLSGIYLWGAPILRKRQNARNRQSAGVTPRASATGLPPGVRIPAKSRTAVQTPAPAEST